MKRFGMIFILVVAGLQMGMAKDPCEVRIKVTGKTAESCEKSARDFLEGKKFATCLTTAWMTEVRQQESDCTKKVMNQSLDLRLLKLKKDSKLLTQFQNEMAIQKHFLKGIEDLCLRQYETCQGSMWTSAGAGCATPFYRLRSQQAEQINQGQLDLSEEVSTPKEPGKPVAPGPELLSYAKQMCQLPSDLWKGQKIPADCEKRLLGRFRAVIPADCGEEENEP